MIMNDLPAALIGWQRMQAEGKLRLLSADEAAAAYGADCSGGQRALAGALQVAPADSGALPAIVAEIMRIAYASKVAVHPISTGRNWGYGSALPTADNCVILDLGQLREIRIDAEMGVVTLQPGVTQGMLADFLDDGGHDFMVPVTGAGPSTSLVGNALERGYGVTPHTDHFSAVTDLEAVLADGDLYRTALREAGGEQLARLFKWGLGTYSAGLFTQSGFGIVTSMSIILARRPECIKVCLFSIKDPAQLGTAIERVREILGKLPGTVGGLNLMNQHRVLAMSAPYPADRLGADGLIPQQTILELGRQYQIFAWTGFGTLYGTKRVVAAAQKEIRASLKGVASRMLFLSASNAQKLAGLAKLLPGAAGGRLASTAATLAKSLDLVGGRPNETALPLTYWRGGGAQVEGDRHPARDGCGLIWYAPLVPMRRHNVQAYIAMAMRICREHGIEPLITLTSLSDKLFDSTVPILFDRADPAQQARAKECYFALLKAGRALSDDHGADLAVFPYRLGIDAMAVVAPTQPLSGAFHRRLRASIDPDNLIAPGRYQ